MPGPDLKAGLRGCMETVVSEANVAPHVPKFSTPSMIQLMEQASMESVVAHLLPGETTVGFEVNVRHLAPADIGDSILACAEVTEVDRNRLTFRVEAHHGDRKIGEGTPIAAPSSRFLPESPESVPRPSFPVP
jgi:fluoroacetyl-CoA thioesterase